MGKFSRDDRDSESHRTTFTASRTPQVLPRDALVAA